MASGCSKRNQVVVLDGQLVFHFDFIMGEHGDFRANDVKGGAHLRERKGHFRRLRTGLRTAASPAHVTVALEAPCGSRGCSWGHLLAHRWK